MAKGKRTAFVSPETAWTALIDLQREGWEIRSKWYALPELYQLVATKGKKQVVGEAHKTFAAAVEGLRHNVSVWEGHRKAANTRKRKRSTK